MRTLNGTTGLRAVLLARVSTAEQTVEQQLHALRQVAEQRGWQVIDEVVEHGVSGTAAKRPGLDKALKLARAGRMDLVAVSSLDRLGRRLVPVLQVLEELGAIGVGFYSIREGLDATTATGRLCLHLAGAFAQFERELAKERSAAGVERAVRAGKRIGRPPLPEEKIEAIREMWAHGYGVRTIAKKLQLGHGSVQRRIERWTAERDKETT